MPGLPWRPIISYGTSPTTISLMYPQKLWDYGTQLIGGFAKSSAGVPESFTIREDNTANTVLRVHDCELLEVRTWIIDAMKGNMFTFQFDADDDLTAFVCYLDAPSFDDGFKPKRDPQWPNMWLIPITIRAVTEIPIFVSMAQLCEFINTTGIAAQQWVLTDLDASALPNGAGKFILALAAPYGSGDSLLDPTATFVPDPISSESLSRSSDVVEWISRPLLAGFIDPYSAVMGGSSSGSPDVNWARMGGNLTLKHWRGGVVIAEYTSADQGFGWLGGGGYNTFSLTGSPALTVLDDDQIGIGANSYYQLDPDGVDDAGRVSFGWGQVPGPLTTTRFYCGSSVTEAP